MSVGTDTPPGGTPPGPEGPRPERRAPWSLRASVAVCRALLLTWPRHFRQRHGTYLIQNARDFLDLRQHLGHSVQDLDKPLVLHMLLVWMTKHFVRIV